MSTSTAGQTRLLSVPALLSDETQTVLSCLSETALAFAIVYYNTCRESRWVKGPGTEMTEMLLQSMDLDPLHVFFCNNPKNKQD